MIFPKLLSGLGVGFTERSIQIAHMDCFGRVLAVEQKALKTGIVVDDFVLDPEALKKELSGLLKKMGLGGKSLRTSVLVPDSRVYTYTMLVDLDIPKDERESVVFNAAQKQIPLPLDTARTVVFPGKKEQDKIRMTLYAAESVILDKIEACFEPSDFQVVSLDMRTKSAFQFAMHGLAPHHQVPKGCVGILEFEQSWVTFSFYAQSGACLLSQSISLTESGAKKKKSDALSKEDVDTIIRVFDEIVLYLESIPHEIGMLLVSGDHAEIDEWIDVFKKQAKEYEVDSMQDLLMSIPKTKKIDRMFGTVLGASLRAAKPWNYSDQHNFLKKII